MAHKNLLESPDAVTIRPMIHTLDVRSHNRFIVRARREHWGDSPRPIEMAANK